MDAHEKMPLRTRKWIVFSVVNVSLPVFVYVMAPPNPVWFRPTVYLISFVLVNGAAWVGFKIAKQKQKPAT